MRINDIAGQQQANTRTVRLGGEKRGKQVVRIGDPRPPVADFQDPVKILAWDGKDEYGNRLNSAGYVCVLETGGRKEKVVFALIN